MKTASRYEMNEPRVVCETMDGEVVAIDLDTGYYFSTNKTAAVIWHGIAAGMTVGEVADTLRNTFKDVAAEVEQQVEAFVRQLVDESLIRERTTPASSAIAASDEPSPYTPPVLETYEDMQELLQADPVHDVETIAWPAASTET